MLDKIINNLIQLLIILYINFENIELIINNFINNFINMLMEIFYNNF